MHGALLVLLLARHEAALARARLADDVVFELCVVDLVGEDLRFHEGLGKIAGRDVAGELIEVNPRYTSQMCSCCGHVAKENRQSQAIFKCQVCGYETNADVNAAKNIITVGQTGLACGSNRISGRKQEPVGNREGVLPMAL